MRKKKADRSLTTPDLVLLSLLAERPMHGYQANLQLELREIRDWAAVSRPQVYYSMEKLARLGYLHEVSGDDAAAEGPERRVYATTAAGRTALAKALAREDWAMQRERPMFLTWLALSWQAEPRVVEEQITRRRKFLETQIARERETLESVLAEVGHRFHEAVWMINLMIQLFQTELRWLKRLNLEIGRRGKAKRPEFISGKAGSRVHRIA